MSQRSGTVIQKLLCLPRHRTVILQKQSLWVKLIQLTQLRFCKLPDTMIFDVWSVQEPINGPLYYQNDHDLETLGAELSESTAFVLCQPGRQTGLIDDQHGMLIASLLISYNISFQKERVLQGNPTNRTVPNNHASCSIHDYKHMLWPFLLVQMLQFEVSKNVVGNT